MGSLLKLFSQSKKVIFLEINLMGFVLEVEKQETLYRLEVKKEQGKNGCKESDGIKREEVKVDMLRVV